MLERHIIDEKDGVMADTYYVYDALGKLRFVLPPALNGMTRSMGNSLDIRSCEALRRYAYFYRYDKRMLLVEKKLPGAAPCTTSMTSREPPCSVRTAIYAMETDGNTPSPTVSDDPFWKVCVCPRRSGCEADVRTCVQNQHFANTASSICGTGYCPNIALKTPSLLTAIYYERLSDSWLYSSLKA